MLFLYRPRQTWMPFGLPRGRTQQAQYNRQLQAQFEATRQLPPPQPAAEEPDPISRLKALAELHREGVLTDEELAQAKARLLGP